MASEINGSAVGAPASTFGLRVFTGKQANRIERYSQCLRQALLTVRAASIIFSCGGNANAERNRSKNAATVERARISAWIWKIALARRRHTTARPVVFAKTFSAVGHVTPLS